jgi:nucleotide-binding universal stress UspA family protein
MTSDTAPTQLAAHATTTQQRVLVAVDPSNHSPGALAWASAEAARLGVAVQPVCAAAYPATHGAPESPELEPDEREGLESLAEQLRKGSEVLPPEVRTGPPVSVVLHELDERTTVLVLGHRDLAGARRLLTGSMSIAIAGRSPVPVAVVPDAWEPGKHDSAPVVVGVDVRADGDTASGDPDVLRVAFQRAAELQVPLVAVHAWEIPALLSWSPSDIQRVRARVDAEFESFLAPWRAEYPGVTVDASAVAERPSNALTDASSVAQLVVVGRHTPATRHGGFHLGSTARMVLHHLKVPVMVVPTPAQAAVPRSDEPFDSWAPMY